MGNHCLCWTRVFEFQRTLESRVELGYQRGEYRNLMVNTSRPTKLHQAIMFGLVLLSTAVAVTALSHFELAMSYCEWLPSVQPGVHPLRSVAYWGSGLVSMWAACPGPRCHHAQGVG